MEITYLMAGKRFQAKDLNSLHQKLAQYQLITNLDTDGCGDLSVRKLSEPEGTFRYDIIQSHGDSADSESYDVVIGRMIGTNGYGKPDLVETEVSALEAALNEVKQDIPDAKIIAGSYWS